MQPLTHLWTSALTGLLLYRRRPGAALALTAAGVLIDADHLLLYAVRSGDWTLPGALRYMRYRNDPGGMRDRRPRYGSLRSTAHHPLAGLALALLAARLPLLRPVAIGIGLHLLLDWSYMPRQWYYFWKAGWRCALCGHQRQLRLHAIIHSCEGGRNTADNLAVLCRACDRDASAWYPLFPPPRPPMETLPAMATVTAEAV